MGVNELSDLNEDQRRQVEMQWQRQQHENFYLDLHLSSYGDTLEGFAVHKGVWNPAITSARYHASYLFHNNGRLFFGKKAIDMGTGSGLMAVVIARYGATNVTASDISPYAVENTKENARIFELCDKIKTAQGDLFENIDEAADCIVFNLPFFPAQPPSGDTISASMLNNGELIHRFLEDAPKYLNKNGVIVMPSYDLAGDTNDPRVQGPKYGYEVETTWIMNSDNGIQQGMLRIHELRR